jgi:hypothetical protein
MRNLNLGLTPSIPPPDIILHASLVFLECHRSLYGVSVGAQHWMLLLFQCADNWISLVSVNQVYLICLIKGSLLALLTPVH